MGARCGFSFAPPYSCCLSQGHIGAHQMEAPLDVVGLLVDALRFISTTNDSGIWIEVYRDAGGGYEGLQAVAAAALEATAPERSTDVRLSGADDQ